MRKVFYVLLRPWLNAIINRSYEIYSSSSTYDRRAYFGGREYAFSQYVNYNLLDYWLLAIREDWVKIVFTPWVFLKHPDLKEYGSKHEHYRDLRPSR